MPKREYIDLKSKITFEKFIEAEKRAAKGKRKKKEIITYEMDLATNLTNEALAIYNSKYESGEYREFKIYEPKERNILSLPFKDRVIQQWYVEECLKPHFEKRFVKTTYACIPRRGSHLAVADLQKEMKKEMCKYMKENNVTKDVALNNMYVLKCDIAKFFHNIDKDILFNIICKITKGKEFLDFTKELIYSDRREKGIPIGNYCSQWFANIYLGELDHYAKETLGIKGYFRFMDDFICICNSKEECKEILRLLTKFVNEELKLELNSKTKYFKLKQGVNFLGFKVKYNEIRFTLENKKKLKSRIRMANKKYIKDKTNINKIRKVVKSFDSSFGYFNGIVENNVLYFFRRGLLMLYI